VALLIRLDSMHDKLERDVRLLKIHDALQRASWRIHVEPSFQNILL
jgi:hypothetical protein